MKKRKNAMSRSSQPEDDSLLKVLCDILKTNSLLEKKALETTIPKILVRSNTYREHERAKRGTHKDAPLNREMENSSTELIKGNSDGSLIKRELELYFEGVKPKLFWPRILSKVRACYKGSDILIPERFVNFEVFDEYKMGRLASPEHLVIADDAQIKVELTWSNAPNFKRKFPSGYVFSAICLFVAPQSMQSESVQNFSEFFPLTLNKGNCHFVFENKLSYEYVLLFLTLHPTEKNRIYKGAPSSGFRCIWGKRLDVFREVRENPEATMLK